MLRYEFEIDGDTYWGTGLTVAGNEVGLWAGYDPYSDLYEAFKEGTPSTSTTTRTEDLSRCCTS
ncbi:MAG: hypothetical protein ACFHWZ_02440 [Phycisphaerales bacterium]